MNKNFLVVGVDACKGKWLTVAINQNGFNIGKYNNIDEVCLAFKHADSILVDMPIGLPESIHENEMRPDRDMRKVLKGKASSVFSVPCRQAIYEFEKDRIRQKNIEVLGKSLSEQSIAIIPKIREIDMFLERNVIWKNKLKESHPEVCFAVLNHGIPVLERKVEWDGMEKRISILEKYYSGTREVISKFKEIGYGDRYINDLLDALCMAVVGMIGLDKELNTLPERPIMDQRGLIMQVVIP